MKWRPIAMKSREMTILAIALGAWGAWRFVGSSLLPVGKQEVGIAIIVLFKPWLDFSGWISLLTINATSYLPSWYRIWVSFIPSYMRMVQGVVETDLVKIGNVGPHVGLAICSCLVISFIYTYFIWPYIWERVYLKAGVWGKLKWGK